MTLRLEKLSFLTAFLYMGCTSSSRGAGTSIPAPVQLPETAAETQAIPITTGASWKIIPTSQPQAYSTLLTTVVVEQDGSTPRRDSLTTRANYSISTTKNADSLSFSGSITSFNVQGSASEGTEAHVPVPIPFTGTLHKHNINTQRSGSQPTSTNLCSEANQASLRIVQRSLFQLPLELTDQQVWKDSTSSIVCSGMLPLTLTSVRTFRMMGESEFEGSPALVIEQTEKTFSKGEGSQGQHRIFIETQGLTNGHLYVDRSSGVLLAADLRNKLSLAIQSSGRVQHFTQNSTEITRRIR